MAAESSEGVNRPLLKISDAFKGLAAVVADSQNAEMELASFALACSYISPLIRLLGMAFKFAVKDYVSKVRDLEKASKSYQTLQSMIDQDVRDNCVRIAGSHTRNLLRVRRGLDMVRAVFEEMLVAEYVHQSLLYNLLCGLCKLLLSPIYYIMMGTILRP